VSIFPSGKSDEVLANIRSHVPRIRYELGQKIRNQLRIIPEIAFFIDDSNDYIDNISNLLKE
jgi:ribosome-binding factor A